MEKPAKPKPSAQQAFNIAVSFHEGSVRCGTNEIDPNTGQQIAPLAPDIVTAAFAAELYMKALVLRREPEVCGHNLEWLFKNALDDAERKAIGSHYQTLIGADSNRLLSDLEKFARAFTEWRYVFEVNERMAEANALLAFVRAAYFAVRDIAPEWPVSQYLHERILAPRDLAAGMYSAEGATLEQALAAFGFVRPKPNVTESKDDGAGRPTGWAVLNHKSASVGIKNVRRRSNPKDRGTD